MKNRQMLDEDGQLEQQCIKCLEWWPADEEFYYPSFATCKACYLEAKYAKRRGEKRLSREIVNETNKALVDESAPLPA